ncbi:MAG: TatD family hydrolase [Anaerolineales bacterium]
MLIDSHCHLDFERFEADREAVLARAREHGVTTLVNPGIDLESSRAAVTLAEQYDMVYAAVGVHPNSGWEAAALEDLRSLAQHPRVVAIGEIGLDYYRDHTAPEAQRRAFRAQLDLASELELPVIVHCREAHADAFEVIRQWQRAAGPSARPAGVFHSFGGDAAQARAATALGFYVGLTGPVTYPQADDMREVAVALPLEFLLVETDAPFLAPQQRRGKRNEPAYVRWIAERVAAERAMDYETFAAATTRNANLLFDWN